MIDQEKSLLDEIDSLSIENDAWTIVYREFLDFPEKARQELDIQREDKVFKLRLPRMENIEKLPQWLIQSVSPREVDVSGQKLPKSYKK